MFEYLNYGGLYTVVFVLLVSILVHRGSKDSDGGVYFIYILGFIMLVLLFFDANTKHNDAKSNIKEFHRGQSLRCHSAGGLYSSGERYKVSEENGWTLDKNYFTKDSLAVEVHKCEKW